MNGYTHNIKILRKALDGVSTTKIRAEFGLSKEVVREVIYDTITQLHKLSKREDAKLEFTDLASLRFNKRLWLELLEKYKDQVDFAWTIGLSNKLAKLLVRHGLVCKEQVAEHVRLGTLRNFKGIGDGTLDVIRVWLEC